MKLFRDKTDLTLSVLSFICSSALIVWGIWYTVFPTENGVAGAILMIVLGCVMTVGSLTRVYDSYQERQSEERLKELSRH